MEWPRTRKANQHRWPGHPLLEYDFATGVVLDHIAERNSDELLLLLGLHGLPPDSLRPPHTALGHKRCSRKQGRTHQWQRLPQPDAEPHNQSAWYVALLRQGEVLDSRVAP